MTDNMTAKPWERYDAHAAETRSPEFMRAFTPNDGGQWAFQMRKAGATVTEPHLSNTMQSAPYVLFASYDARNEYRVPTLPHFTEGHPYVITTYCEGDLVTEFYATAEDRDRALWLLERAL